MTRQGRIRIGTSGWQYRHWRGDFYPRGLPQKREFEHYARQFDTVEVNNSFYRLPAPETFDAWREQAPRGFLYALKYSRFGSHLKRLKEAEGHVGLFLERATRLGRLLGPVLVQLPPQMKMDAGRLDEFLHVAPNRCRWAIEFRHESWLCDAVFDLLRRHNAALCIHDIVDPHPRVVTADFVYIRYHGGGDRYRGDYPDSKLRADAREIEAWTDRGLDVFAYFNNDALGCAPRNAATLLRTIEKRATAGLLVQSHS